MKRKTAIILARVSTAGQAQEELPIESQLDACKTKAEQLEADVLKVFIEGGVSGRKENRDVFEQAAEYCRVMAVDYFIIWNTARFARHRALAAYTKWKLRRGGTQMVYASQAYIDVTTRGGRMLEGLFEILDEDYAQQVSEDTLRSMMRNAREGFFNGGRVPFGYVAIPAGKRKRLAALEEEAAIVRAIFTKCLDGVGTFAIALWLNGSGLRRRGRAWTKNAVGHLLKNWVYAGYVTFNRVNHSTRAERPEEDWIRTKSHPEIVGEEDFKRVQQLIGARVPVRGSAGSPASGFILTGLAKCGVCGMGMQIQTGTGRGGVLYSYYRCAGALQGKLCTGRAVRADQLDREILEQILDQVLTKENVIDMAQDLEELTGVWVRQRAERREVLVRQMRDAENRRRNLLDVLEAHGRGAPNLADLSLRLRELNAQLKSLEGELAALEDAKPPVDRQTEDALVELGLFAQHLLRNGEPSKVRAFLTTFVDNVEVRQDTADINYDPERLLLGSQQRVRWLPDQGLLRTTLQVKLPPRFFKRPAVA